MTTPSETRALCERVLELHRQCQKRHRSPEMGRWIDTRNREYLDAAPELATALLASESAREELAGKVAGLEGLLSGLVPFLEKRRGYMCACIDSEAANERCDYCLTLSDLRAHLAPKPAREE